MKKLNNKGFSLIELIVVIAIMAVLMAILVPSLLGYVEKSRMQRDDSAMSEVVESFKLALCDFDTYDEAYSYAAEGNYLTYTDSSGVYGQRIMDEEQWTPDGSGKCLTITFNPDEDGEYTLANAKINNMGTAPEGAIQGVFCDMEHLNAKVEQVIGSTLENVSATYRNSSYTVFVTFDDTVSVYGQWNGTNLSEAADVGDSVACEHEYILDRRYLYEDIITNIYTCSKCGDSYEEQVKDEQDGQGGATNNPVSGKF